MKTELLLVRDGLEGAAPWMAQVLRDAGFGVRTTSAAELGDITPAEVILLRIPDRNPTAAGCASRRLRAHLLLDVRVPVATLRASAQPFRRLVAAFLAGEDRLQPLRRLHVRSVTIGRLRDSCMSGRLWAGPAAKRPDDPVVLRVADEGR